MSQNILINLHDILLSKELYLIQENNSKNIIVDYYYAKINYLLDLKNNKIQLFPETNNFDSMHIFRLLVSKKILDTTNSIGLDEEYISEYLLELNKILLFGYKNYCTICGCELDAKGLYKISHCDDIKCINEYYSIPTDNRVMELYNKDSVVFMFLLNVFISGLYHPKVEKTFVPFPNIPNTINITQLKNIIPSELQIHNYTKLMEILNNSLNDLDLYSKLKPYSYCIIKNAISNNYFSMSSREDILSDNSTTFIHINYSAEIENKFQQNYFLFHGSSMYSWYPIIKNGLKVMSGTSLQANGSAYGNGIYLSNSFRLSLGYSKNVLCGTDMNVVGVFEILEDPDKYNKASNIFVIPDDKILLLRTFILVKNKKSNYENITKYFIKNLPLQKKINKIGVKLVKNKRLNSEYKKLLEIDFINNIILPENPSSEQSYWIIEFSKIKNTSIQIKMIFSNYPILPPIIKLMSNIQINGLVGNDNTIKIDLIEPFNWKLTNNLTEICTYIYNCLEKSL